MFMNKNIAALRAAYPSATIKVSGTTQNGEMVFAVTVMTGETILSEIELSEKLVNTLDEALAFALMLAGFETVEETEQPQSDATPVTEMGEQPVEDKPVEVEASADAEDAVQPKKRRGRKPKTEVIPATTETSSLSEDVAEEPETEPTEVQSDTEQFEAGGMVEPQPVEVTAADTDETEAQSETSSAEAADVSTDTESEADPEEMTMEKAKETVATLLPNASVGNNKRLSTEIVGKKLGSLTKLHIRLLAKSGSDGKPSAFTPETVAAARYLRKNSD